MSTIRPPPLKLKAKQPYPPYDKGVRKVDVKLKKRESKSGMDQLRSSWKKFSMDIQTPTAEVTASGATINGYPVNSAQVLFLAETFGIRIRNDNHYWYDKESGFFGKVGGILQKDIDPRLKIMGNLDPRSSAGDTSIFINGREILKEEKKNWKRSGMILDQHYESSMSQKQSSSYRYKVDPLGNVFDEKSGNLLFNWRQKYADMQKKQLAIGATVVGVALLGGMAGGEGMMFGGGEEAMFGGGGGESFYSSGMTGAASNWDSSGAGYISFDDGSSVSIGL